MELSREQIRAIIFHEWKNSSTVDVCFDRMVVSLGEACPTKQTIYNWYNSFVADRMSLQDLPRSGRQLTAVTPENIEKVRELITNDPRITYIQIEKTLDIGSSATNTILEQHLQVKKVCVRWVPRFLSKSEKKARLDFAKNFVSSYGEGKERRLAEIITGDETWLYYYDPKNPQQSKE